jgi:hypothetical protein
MVKVMLKVLEGWLRHLVVLEYDLTSISFVLWGKNSTKPTGQRDSQSNSTHLINNEPIFAAANILAHCFVNIGNVRYYPYSYFFQQLCSLFFTARGQTNFDNFLKTCHPPSC